MARHTRRTFMKQSAALAGGASLASLAGRAMGQATPAAGTLGANGRLRLGVIGTGGQGRTDLMTFIKATGGQIDVPIICDVDDAMLGKCVEALDKAGKPKPVTVQHFRKVLEHPDVDIVLIATPDHWHALQTIEACQAGKDVYCEKPLANSIGEGRAMVEFARKHQRVVQMGTQWRTSTHHAEAVEYVHSGQLGKIRLVRCWCALAWFKFITARPDSDPPAGVDYDLWLGPASGRRFNPNRFHFHFRWFWDYAGGLMTDWGVHLLNLALWAMKAQTPKRVSSSGGNYLSDGAAETPDTQCTLYDYGNFTLLWEHQASTGHGAENREHGVAFYGQNATLVMDAHGWEVMPEKDKGVAAVSRKREEETEACRVRLVKDFLTCVASRGTPAENIELGQFVTATAHLGNLALRTGRSIEYDADKMQCIGNEQANAMITAKYREPWTLPKL